MDLNHTERDIRHKTEGPSYGNQDISTMVNTTAKYITQG